jgi:hypothetical protein
MRLDDIQYLLNGGIYSPKLAEREDTEGYYAAVRDMLNMRPEPEGGASARGGYMMREQIRGTLVEIDLAAAVITGGTGVTIGEVGSPVTYPDYPFDPGDYPDFDIDFPGRF